MASWWSRLTRQRPRTHHVTLRDIREADDTRLMQATLHPDGILEITGCDWGDTVERLLGEREYEWAWRLPREEVDKLRAVLDDPADLTAELAARFSGDDAAHLKTFLDCRNITYEAWSRTGP